MMYLYGYVTLSKQVIVSYICLETLRFYKALSQIGTDFTLMSQAFGKFTSKRVKGGYNCNHRLI